MLGGENVRELLCIRVYVGQQFLKRNGGSGGRAMTFGISPHRPGRILPGGVEVKRRDWCGVGTEETIRCQSPRVGAPSTGDINQEEGIGLWPAESRVC